MIHTVSSAFSISYREARAKFLEAAAIASSHAPKPWRIGSKTHPLLGIEGEDLAMDFAASDPNAPRQLIISSACHGIEGYCGSGVQVFALSNPALLEQARKAGIGLLFIHALNPHGFSFGRRVTNENVDLNRNFHAGPATLPRNEAYAHLHDLLLPEVWPPDQANQDAVQGWIAQHGMKAFQAAVSQGQYEFADGLFYGGVAPTWSNTSLRGLLRELCAGKTHIGWIDLHTGLGPSGYGERIFAGPNDAATLARARAWWGNAGNPSGETPVTSIYDGSSTSAYLTGLMWMCIYDECPGAEFTAIAMEYGTLDLMDMLQALRADHWLHRARARGQSVDPALAERIRLQIRAAFYVETDVWKGQIISQGMQSISEGIAGLAASR